MSTKAKRRQQAMKRDRRRNRIIASVCFSILLGLVIMFIVGQIQQRGTRVYVSGNNSVVLRGDGTFTASLPHGVVRNGTFSESTSDGVTTVSFVEGPGTVSGVINGDVLTIPDEWDDGHRHPRNYTLRP